MPIEQMDEAPEKSLYSRRVKFETDVKRLKGFQMASRGLLGRLEEVSMLALRQRKESKS